MSTKTIRRLLLGACGAFVTATAVYWFVDATSLKTPTRGETMFDMEIPFEMFKRDIGRYPTEEEGIRALFERPVHLGDRWRGRYWVGDYEHDVLDWWGRPFQYRNPGRHNPTRFDLFTLGPDGVESEDDFGNW